MYKLAKFKNKIIKTKKITEKQKNKDKKFVKKTKQKLKKKVGAARRQATLRPTNSFHILASQDENDLSESESESESEPEPEQKLKSEPVIQRVSSDDLRRHEDFLKGTEEDDKKKQADKKEAERLKKIDEEQKALLMSKIEIKRNKHNNDRKVLLNKIIHDIKDKAAINNLNINLTIKNYKPEIFGSCFKINFDNNDIEFAKREDNFQAHLTISPNNQELNVQGSHITIYIPKSWASNYPKPTMHIYRDGTINFKWQNAHNNKSLYPKSSYRRIDLTDNNIAETLYNFLNENPLELEIKDVSTTRTSHPNNVNLGVNCHQQGWECAEANRRDENQFKEMIKKLQILLKAMNTVLQKYNNDILQLLPEKKIGGNKTRKKYKNLKKYKSKSIHKYYKK